MQKLLIWGTGNLAKRFIENEYHGELIGFIETHKSKDTYMGKPVYGYREMPKDFDYIIIANSYGEEIYDLCLEMDIDLSQVIFLYRFTKRIGCTATSILKEILAEKNYVDYCIRFKTLEDTFVYDDAAEYQRLNKRPTFSIDDKNMWPVISDKYSPAGSMGNYFWQDLWAARLIGRSGVRNHFDIGSRIDGFIAHLLAMEIEVTLIDIREFPTVVENLNTIVDDATSLRQIEDESIDSMSALCSLEHFGLGRYGDPVDPEACFRCFQNIQNKLKAGGNLYLSVPIGKERVEFNAHRVFYADTIVNQFDRLQLVEFSCAAEGAIEYNVDIHKYDNDEHNGEHRYGLFHFVKENLQR